jgi:hypothetical protein
MSVNLRATLATLFTLTAVAVGQAPDEPGSIRGRIVRAGTTEGLSKAVVELVPAGVGSLTDFDYNPAAFEAAKARSGMKPVNSNEKGEFVFEQVPVGLYRIEARRDRFSYTPNGAVVDVQPRAQVQNVSVAMTPAAAITGVVLDESDKPVPFAVVTSLSVDYVPGGVRALRTIAFVETNDLGEYRLYGLAPGEYLVSVDLSDTANREPRVRQNIPQQPKSYAIHYYPGTPEIGAASPVRVRESGLDVGGIDVRLRQTPLATVRGKFLMNVPSTTTPPPPVSLMMTLASFPDASPDFRYRPNAAGEFEIPNVAPGSYLLKATGRARNSPSLHSSMMRVEVGSKDIEGLAVPVVVGPTVTGTLRIDGIDGLLPFDATALVRFTGRVSGVNGFYSRDGFDGLVSPNGSYSTGGFAFPGSFDIALHGLPPGYYLKTPLTLEIPSADIPPSISVPLTLGHHQGVVSGIVNGTDRRPVTGAIVVLVPAEALRTRADRYLRALSDGTGRFRVVSPPPGDYTAFAFEGIEGDAFYNPEFLQRYLGRGVRVSIRENADASVNLQLIPWRDSDDAATSRPHAEPASATCGEKRHRGSGVACRHLDADTRRGSASDSGEPGRAAHTHRPALYGDRDSVYGQCGKVSDGGRSARPISACGNGGRFRQRPVRAA